MPKPASLYDIPPGCICYGDGLLGMKCTATEHARLRVPDYQMPSWAKHPARRLRLLRTLRGDWPIGHLHRAEARIYEMNEIYLNPHGAVAVLTSAGWLGVKPDEMEWCA